MRGRNEFDSIAVYTDLQIRMDQAAKEIVPGRSPWRTWADALSWMSATYHDAVVSLADHYGVGPSTIRRHGPGVRPFMLSAKEWR